MLVMDSSVMNDTGKTRRNAEYLAKLDEAERNIAAGLGIVFENDDWMSWTPEQLKAYADEQRASRHE
jgi:hypothetical protein